MIPYDDTIASYLALIQAQDALLKDLIDLRDELTRDNEKLQLSSDAYEASAIRWKSAYELRNQEFLISNKKLLEVSQDV